MFKIGYRFTVRGEYCVHLLGLPDPNDEDWELFELCDLHPGRMDVITVMVANYNAPCEAAKEEAIERAVHVIEWMRGEKGWQGFDAHLWTCKGDDLHERAFRWELC